MNQQLNLVTLGVADLTTSRRFYSRGLGWTPLLDLDEVVFYQVGKGLVVALFPVSEMAADVGHPVTAGTAFTLAQNLASATAVDQMMGLAQAAGATILKEPQRWAFGGYQGYQGYFADPDGHRWEVSHNPGWSVADDGTVTLAAAPPPRPEG